METTAPTPTTDVVALLDQGFTWTAARIEAIPAGASGSPTPCGQWTLRDLIEHTLDTVGVFADAIDGSAGPADPAAGERSWGPAFAKLGARVHRGWTDPDALGRTYELRFGTMPGPIMASANLLEVVTHGWDIAQATEEDASIPDELAVPILAFARAAITDDSRGDSFGPAMGVDPQGTPGDQLVAFLGRTPA